MKRREFITLVGGAAAWPVVARAQSAHPVIGFLSGSSSKPSELFVASIHGGLKDAGFVEGQNLKIEYRWAESRYDRLPALAKELVDLKVRAIVAFGGNDSALVAKLATSTIPIVFTTAEDPVTTGLVTNLSRPSGNLTGVTWMGADLQAKNIELLHGLFPNVPVFGLLFNPSRASAALVMKNAQDAADSIGKKLRVLNATDPSTIDSAFALIVEEQIGALVISGDPLFSANRERIVALATRHRVPTAYYLRDFVAIGGLMSYGSRLHDAYFLIGDYAGRILKGATPADLPIQRTTKVELVLNLKTAKTLGLTIPLTMLGRADEVIE